MATYAQEQRRDDGSRLFDKETIDGALAHFVGGVTGAYQRSQHLEARRELASAWGAFASTHRDADPSGQSEMCRSHQACPPARKAKPPHRVEIGATASLGNATRPGGDASREQIV
jgi:hypothetical protein